MIIVNILAIISVVVFGSIITFAITTINVAVLLIFMAAVYLGFSVIWAVDRVYLFRKRSIYCMPRM